MENKLEFVSGGYHQTQVKDWVQKKNSVVTNKRNNQLNLTTQRQTIERPKSGGEKISTSQLSGSHVNQGQITERRQVANLPLANLQHQIDELALVQERDGPLLDQLPFDREVDFHHQIAYAYEKSYRLRENNKPEAVVKAANTEITQLIASQKWILQLDPLILFYSLYFSVFYRNEETLTFLKDLIHKLGFTSKHFAEQLKARERTKRSTAFKSEKTGNNEFDKLQQIEKIQDLMQKIKTHGISTLASPGTSESLQFYHTVFYQAVQDNLRLVYDQIMGKVDVLYLRDLDALHFIKQRDWRIIEKSFSKNTRSSNMTQMFMHKNLQSNTAHKYKMYNRAYYQELIIKNDVESRTKFLFSQKFLKTKEDIDSVLEMYCQIDDLEQFDKFSKQMTLSEKRVESLFLVCLRYDSMKIAFHLNLHFGIKYNQTVISALNVALRESQWYLELKLFFVRQSFIYLNVAQMDELLSLFQEIFNVNSPKCHPLVNCYNPVKISMLVYEVCWNVQRKNIYSLQRKCNAIMTYLKTSLDKYFNAQGNISHLYKLLREPILHSKEQKDSMDMMFLMNMDEIIQHKVVEEVLNLVYDGKYSIDTSPLYLSSLWNTLEQMPTFSPKSVFKRLISNINTMGAWRLKKQSSVQFHIWK